MRRLWVPLAMAIAIGGGVIITQIPSGGGGGGGSPTWPNTTAANVFIDDSGSDAGSNCVRFATAQSTPPTASTVCQTASQAYTLANAGDTVWVLPGTYSGSDLNFTSGTAPTSKTVSDNTDCHSTHQCVYFMPQPGQASNVITNEIDFKGNLAPQHMYWKGFIRGACPSFSNANAVTTGSNDITADGFVNDLATDADCIPYLFGPNKYIRIINGNFEHECRVGETGGMQIQSNQSGQGGEATDHIWAPDHFLIANNTFSQVDISCEGTGHHQDCIHHYASINSTFRGNTFINCFDSALLVGALDEPGFAENNIIENNWFGPTILGVNACCLRGDTTASNETFDNWIIRFNSSTSTWMNKTGLVLNNVSFIGNVGLGTNLCVTGTGTIYRYNVSGSTACDATDTGSQTNTDVKFVDITTAALDLHIQAGSVAIDKVPTSQSDGCAAVVIDKDGDSRPTSGSCDAGADER